MPIYNMIGGGGTGINLKVVGGTTQPTTPKENTVWVNTSAAINGYVVSATAPSSPASGMVWIKTGSTAAAPIDIDKKNSIILYPNSCYQYINGAWAAKTAITFVNGAWKNWAIYLLENGADNTAVTGGWQGKAQYISADATGRVPTISFSSGKMVITQNGSAGNNAGIVYAKNKIDLSGYNRITVTAYSTQTQTNNAKLAVWSAEPNDWDGVANVSVAGTTVNTYTLDVSALSGEYYIGLTFYQYNGGTLTVENDLKIE